MDSFDKILQSSLPSCFQHVNLSSFKLPCMKAQHSPSKIMLSLSEQHEFLQSSNSMAFIEDQQSLIYAFSNRYLQNTELTIKIFNKSNGKCLTKNLTAIPVHVCKLQFAINQALEQVCLIAATECGYLFVYKFIANHNEISIRNIKISHFKLIDLLSYRTGLIFALGENHTIYLVNYLTLQVQCQFISIPLQFLPTLSHLVIDQEQKYLALVCLYGKIVFWEIQHNLQKSTSTRHQLHSNTSQNSLKDRKISQTNIKCQKSTNQVSIHQEQLKEKKQDERFHKHFRIKPKMIITECTRDGLIWCDFIGLFLRTISPCGKVQILAISLNELNEPQQNYEVMTRMELIQSKNHQIKNSGKSQNMSLWKAVKKENITFDEKIVHVERYKRSPYGLLIGKINTSYLDGVMQENNSVIEMLEFNSKWEAQKIKVIKIAKISLLEEFKLSQCMQFLLIRSGKKIIIAREETIFQIK